MIQMFAQIPMTEDPKSVMKDASIVALAGKKIFFRLPIDGIRMTAEGNGTLEMNETPDKQLEVSIIVWQWPNSGIGTVRINRFYLNQKEVALLRPALNPDYEIECIAPSIRTP